MSMPSPTGPGNGPPIPDLNCDSSECVAALAMLVTARNDVIQACSDAAAAQAERDVFGAIAAAMLAAAIALAVAAAAATGTIFGFPAGVVLGIAAAVFFAVFLVCAIIALGFEIARANAMGRVSAGQDKFNEAAANVMTACPRMCWGDLTLPKC
jgi:hypothetical protein